MKKRIITIILLSLSLISCVNTEKNSEKVIVKKVGKEVITEEEIQKELNYIGITTDTNLRNDIIENLILQKMLKQEAIERGLQKDETYKKELKRVEYLLLSSLILEKEVYQKVSKDEELLNKYYDDNLEKFDFEKVKISHIVIKNVNMTEIQKKEALKRAESILVMALEGENFYSLAQKFSEAPDAKWGGEIGYITKGDMVIQLEDVAFNNKIGVYNKVVETMYGYEIILISDKKEKKNQLKELSESQKNEIKDLLLNDYYNNYIKDLKKKYNVN